MCKNWPFLLWDDGILISYHKCDGYQTMSSQISLKALINPFWGFEIDCHACVLYPWILSVGFLFLKEFTMRPKEKSTKATKKVSKGSMPQRLFNESDYEEEDPQLKRYRKKKSPKVAKPPPQSEEKRDERTEAEEPSSSTHTPSKQTTSKQPNSTSEYTSST